MVCREGRRPGQSVATSQRRTVVSPGSDEQAAVGMKSQAKGVLIVSLELADLLPRGRVPQSQRSAPDRHSCQQCTRRIQDGPFGEYRQIADSLLGRHIPERDAAFSLIR